MALKDRINSFRKKDQTVNENDPYYSSSTTTSSSFVGSIFYALIAVFFTLLVAAAIFYGGRAIYRVFTDNSSETETTQQSGDNQDQPTLPSATPGTDVEPTPATPPRPQNGNLNQPQPSNSTPNPTNTTPKTGDSDNSLPHTGDPGL